VSKFVKNIAIFLTSLPLLVPRAHATSTSGDLVLDTPEPDAVPLRPLNSDGDNPFAGHSSHSSHASHASHYSGSGGGGGYTAPPPSPYVPDASAVPSPPPPAPTPAPAPTYLYGTPSPTPPVTSPAPGSAGRQAGGSAASLSPMPALSPAERLRLQIMRVQIRLTSLGLYNDRIDGVRNPATIQALKQFQSVKGLPESGMMTTPTLNALGVPAN
jgi:His-Xaa-Ser repeat protein HxsA